MLKTRWIASFFLVVQLHLSQTFWYKGFPRFFLLRSTGNKAVISSNTALKTSDLQLFNAGSTIKIGHFFADINPFEIKVSKPEISDFLKKNRILHQQSWIFESKTMKKHRVFLENERKIEPYQTSVTYLISKFELLSWWNLM